MSPFFSYPRDSLGAEYPDNILDSSRSQACRTPLMTCVSASDVEHELYIRDCGREIELAMAEWERSGCFAAHGEASFWEAKQREAIARRSPSMVARLEQERGLG